MKKEFFEAEIEVIKFGIEDIITTSNNVETKPEELPEFGEPEL